VGLDEEQQGLGLGLALEELLVELMVEEENFHQNKSLK